MVKKTINKNVFVIAGGTGGHIFPGLALADTLKKKQYNVFWLASKGGIEQKIVAKYNYPILTINSSGFRGKSIIKKIKSLYNLVFGIIQSFFIIKKYKPIFLVGMGGFVSGVACLSAAIIKKPFFLHEQNTIAGISNRYLGKYAKCCFQGFDNTLNTAITSGNPIFFTPIIKNKPIDKKINLLVLGGSQGAIFLNSLIIDVYKNINKISNINLSIWLQCGTKNYQKLKHLSNNTIKISPFIEDMAESYSWSDISLCRAGAMTISELIATQTPAIFVPYPYSIDNHQTSNAKKIVNIGAGFLLPQKQCNYEKLIQILNSLDKDKIFSMKKNISSLKKNKDPAEYIAECIEKKLY